MNFFKNLSLKNNYKNNLYKDNPFSGYFLEFLKKVENMGSKNLLLSKFYSRLFYEKMVLKEIKGAGLNKNNKILHIGCGALPLTPIILARKGYKVLGIDNEEYAVNRAKKLTDKYGLSDIVKYKLQDGANINNFNYNAVWISLHVFPKRKIIQQIIENQFTNCKIIYRNPRGWLKKLYTDLDPREFAVSEYKSINHFLGKKSVIIDI